MARTSDNKCTIGYAISELNKVLHKKGAHVEVILDKLNPESMTSSDAPQHLMSQTFDWRYDFIKPEKDVYDVKLTVDDLRYIGNAMEVFSYFQAGRWIKPALERMITKLGEVAEE